MKLGICIFGLATVATGIFDLIWDEFEAAHQPIQAWGNHIPGQHVFAYAVALWLITCGLAILWPRTARAGAVGCGIIYLIFAMFWVPRFYTAPQVLGYRIATYIGVSSGVAQQLILIAAAVIVYAAAATSGFAWQARAAVIARWTLGVCSVNFGLAHLTGVQVTSSFVPKWMPLGGNFWAIVTAICFVLAGLAIMARILDVPAARLLTLMLFVFSAVVLAPPVFASPRDHVAWGANAYNLAAVGAVWTFASSIAKNYAAQQRDRGSAASWGAR